MAFYNGYDTDDLTQRQYHYFCKLNAKSNSSINMTALNFMRYCIMKNMSLNRFDNYEGDCEYLFNHAKQSEEAGIDLSEVYA